MSSASRHIAGAVVGLLAAPALGLGLAWAPGWIGLTGAPALADGRLAAWVLPLAAAVLLGLLLAVLTGSRISPLAALIPGLALGAAGVLRTVGAPVPVSFEFLSAPPGGDPWFAWPPLFIAVGAMLTLSALFPTRWRTLHEPADGRAMTPTDDEDWTDGAHNVRVAAPRGPADGAPLWDSDAPPPDRSTAPEDGWNGPHRDREAP